MNLDINGIRECLNDLDANVSKFNSICDSIQNANQEISNACDELANFNDQIKESEFFSHTDNSGNKIYHTIRWKITGQDVLKNNIQTLKDCIADAIEITNRIHSKSKKIMVKAEKVEEKINDLERLTSIYGKDYVLDKLSSNFDISKLSLNIARTSSDAANWNFIAEDKILKEFWIDETLKFEKSENGTYSIWQKDSNGNYQQMGWTNETTKKEYENLNKQNLIGTGEYFKRNKEGTWKVHYNPITGEIISTEKISSTNNVDFEQDIDNGVNGLKSNLENVLETSKETATNVKNSIADNFLKTVDTAKKIGTTFVTASVNTAEKIKETSENLINKEKLNGANVSNNNKVGSGVASAGISGTNVEKNNIAVSIINNGEKQVDAIGAAIAGVTGSNKKKNTVKEVAASIAALGGVSSGTKKSWLTDIGSSAIDSGSKNYFNRTSYSDSVSNSNFKNEITKKYATELNDSEKSYVDDNSYMSVTKRMVGKDQVLVTHYAFSDNKDHIKIVQANGDEYKGGTETATHAYERLKKEGLNVIGIINGSNFNQNSGSEWEGTQDLESNHDGNANRLSIVNNQLVDRQSGNGNISDPTSVLAGGAEVCYGNGKFFRATPGTSANELIEQGVQDTLAIHETPLVITDSNGNGVVSSTVDDPSSSAYYVRNVLGQDANGEIYVVTGKTNKREVAEYMVNELGCVWASSMDQGGSVSNVVLGEEMQNQGTGERAVGDFICFYS